MLEILKAAEAHKAQVVLSGDTAQMGSVERGRMFSAFIARYGSENLSDVQRQKREEQRAIARELGKGDISRAFDAIQKVEQWAGTRQEAFEALVKQWMVDRALFSP